MGNLFAIDSFPNPNHTNKSVKSETGRGAYYNPTDCHSKMRVSGNLLSQLVLPQLLLHSGLDPGEMYINRPFSTDLDVEKASGFDELEGKKREVKRMERKNISFNLTLLKHRKEKLDS